MYAKIEHRRVSKTRIVLTRSAKVQLCRDFGITFSTLAKYVVDIFNYNIIASARNEVVMAAINKYGGKLEETQTWKDVLVVDKFDEPENHREE